MAVTIRPKNSRARIVPMCVMGDAMDGEYVLDVMLDGESLKGFTYKDFIIEEIPRINLDPPGMVLAGPGREVFTFQSERFSSWRTMLGTLVGMFNREDLQERVPMFFRMPQDLYHVYIPTMARDGLVRRLQRAADEFDKDEASGVDQEPKECPRSECGEQLVRESPVIGTPFWACERHGR